MRISTATEDVLWAWLIAIAASGLAAAMLGCGQATDGCERSAYELERERYRCTSEGELQTLDCDEWVTLDVCADRQSCSPGPTPGCS